MPSYQPPKRGFAYITYISLVSQADVKLLQANPTLAAGDVKVSIDGGAFANLTTLPTVTPAGGKAVKVSLSATEMLGDNIKIVFSDAAGAEWCDLTLDLQTASAQFEDVSAIKVIADSLVILPGGEIQSRLSAAGIADLIVSIGGPISQIDITTILTRLGIPITADISHDIANIGKGGLTVGQADQLTAIATSILNPAGFKRNTAVPNFDFPMRDTLGNLRVNPINLTARRRIDGGTFDPCINTPVYVSDGMCTINLAASDINGNKITYLFQAQNCKPTIITIYTEP